MKPRDLTQKTWDVKAAVFKRSGFGARVTFSCDRMWFRVDTPAAFADVFIPIRIFRRAADKIVAFDLNSLKPENPNIVWRVGSYRLEVCAMFGVKRGGRWVQKKGPPIVLICPSSERVNHALVMPLREFRKLAEWYDKDVKV